jgi:glycosyltransferase involved in cell wall biosynthesis
LEELLKVDAYNFSSVFGGQERYLEILAQKLSSRGHTVAISGSPARILRQQAKRHIARNVVSVELLNGNRALYLRGWRTSKADVRLYVQHSSVCDSQGGGWRVRIREFLLRHLLNKMDAVIRVSNNSLPDHFAPGRIKTVYNGVASLPLKKNRTSDRPLTFLMVGALTENKNQVLGLELLQRLEASRLIVVGDGPRRDELRDIARKLGVADRVHWTGFVSDPGPLYEEADFLLLLSKFEAFPFAVLEAMSFGLVVIATPVGGVSEAITHDKDGIILDSWDIDELFQTVQRLWNQPETRAQLAKCARKTVAERFTAERMVDGFIATISDTIKNSRSGR